MQRFLMATLFVAASLAGCLGDEPVDADGDDAMFQDVTGDDAVVIAVIDSGINPYHFDYAARLMPQHLNSEAGDDLPLDVDPAQWLPGHPGGDVFASYAALELNLSDDPEALSADLYNADSDAWSGMEVSSGEEDGGIHMRYVPGTKIVGFVSFNGNGWGAGSHGGGSASSTAGTIHGACPECLIVFVNGLGHEANEWVAKQDWIDLQTNSWGYSATIAARDRIHTGCDTADQQMAVERGQQLFFSAGNGLGNAFVAPNPTLFSCQEGPDWIVTVGAINEADGSSVNAGTPVDVASVGGGYPSAYCSTTINCTGSFGGTSNATPATAGMYAKALWEIRHAIPGATRMQENGVIAAGDVSGLEAAEGSALADGELTVHELRQALYDASVWQAVGRAPAGAATVPVAPEESVLMGEGHGSFWARYLGDDHYATEWSRIIAMATGAESREYAQSAQDFFVAMSYCTQEAWGHWDHGDYQGDLPATNPNQPLQTFMTDVCPQAVPVVSENFPETWPPI